MSPDCRSPTYCIDRLITFRDESGEGGAIHRLWTGGAAASAQEEKKQGKNAALKGTMKSRRQNYIFAAACAINTDKW